MPHFECGAFNHSATSPSDRNPYSIFGDDVESRLSGAGLAPMSAAEHAKMPVEVPAMPDSVMSPTPSRFRPAVWAGAAVIGAMAAGTIVLWIHYGSAVFFEMIMAGLAACF
jgi:hypothetical protein